MDEQICENCGFERELNRGLCEGCEAERIATAPLLATIAALESRLAEVERELDRVRVDLVTAQHAIGEGWFAGGADTATAIERKTRALEDCARDASVRAAAAEERAQEAEARVAAAEARVRELEGALREACDLLDSYEDAAACEDDVATVRLVDAFTRRARTLLTPTAPTAGAGLCSARVNSAGNLCLMPAGHAGDHYPPTERAPQVIVRTDGTGSNPTPAPKQAGEGESNWFRAFCTPCYGSGRAHSIFDTCMCEPPCEGRGVCGACGGTGRVANRKES